MKTAKPIQTLINEFQKLPSIGPKSAARLTYFLLRAPKDRAQSLAEAILDIKQGTKTCEVCFNITEGSPCETCKDGTRDHSIIMVVEEPMDVVAIERTGKFNGVYHVLGGVINPPAGIGPEELRIKELLERLVSPDEKFGSQKAQSSSVPSKNFSVLSDQRRTLGSGYKSSEDTEVLEVILATNPTTEGEATAMYVANEVRKLKTHPPAGGSKLKTLKMTRIARGLPTGGDLEYADTTTLIRSFEGRVEY